MGLLGLRPGINGQACAPPSLFIFRFLETELVGQKISFHRELTDLSVMFIDLGLLMLISLFALLKELTGFFNQGPSPEMAHRGVNPVATC